MGGGGEVEMVEVMDSQGEDGEKAAFVGWRRLDFE